MPTTTTPPAERLVTGNFLLACACTLGHFMSFSLLTAALPVWALARGASEVQIGLLVALIAFPALIARSLSGWLVDRQDARRYVMLGTFIYGSIGTLYALTPSVEWLLALRVYHGIGLGVFHTAASVYVTDIVPAARRGEGIGYYGMMQTLSQAAGPALGIWIADQFDYTGLWVACTALGFAAFAMAARLQPSPRARQATPLRLAALVAPGAIAPSIAACGLFLGTGTVISFLAVYALDRGVANPGLLYGIQALATFFARGAAGRLSDRFGRTAVVVPSLLITSGGLWVLSLADNLLLFGVACVLLGVGAGCAFPALIAQSMDRVQPQERGAAMSTFGIGQELGIGGGSLAMGLLATSVGYSGTFLLAALCPVAGLVLALVSLGRRR